MARTHLEVLAAYKASCVNVDGALADGAALFEVEVHVLTRDGVQVGAVCALTHRRPAAAPHHRALLLLLPIIRLGRRRAVGATPFGAGHDVHLTHLRE